MPRKRGRSEGRRKILWPVALPQTGAHSWERVKELATSKGSSISAAITAIFAAAGLPEVGFDPLPKGARMNLTAQEEKSSGTYFIPIEYAAKMVEWQRMGYSNAYLVKTIVARGIDALERQGILPALSEAR